MPENPTRWELAEASDRLYAEVVFNRPLKIAFHYLVPEELRDLVGPGRRVEAPFGSRNEKLVGYCVAVSRDAPRGRAIKSLTAVLDRQPLIDAHLLQLTRWIAERYLCGWGQVLEAVIPAGVKSNAGTRNVVHFHLADSSRDEWPQLKLPAKQRAVLQVLADNVSPVPVDRLSEAANCGLGPIHALRDRGLIVAERVRTISPSGGCEPPGSASNNGSASNQGAHAPRSGTRSRSIRSSSMPLDAILNAVRSGEHTTFLLHGVTGSGKTEVYIRAIEEVVSYGRQAIVLVPEISLTPQTIRRFRRRFSAVAVLHSHMTDVERHSEWKRIAEGSVQVVVGARSAVFAPTPHLGLIVIDEEHETSFKQDSTRGITRERGRLSASIAGWRAARPRFGNADAGIVAAGESRVESRESRAESRESRARKDGVIGFLSGLSTLDSRPLPQPTPFASPSCCTIAATAGAGPGYSR